MGSRRVLPFAFALLMGVSALAQGPTYGIGTHADRRGNPRAGISPSVRPERNSRREKAPPRKARRSIARRDARDATARRASAARRPILKSKDPANPDVWARGRILPLRAPFATTVWDYINRGMPLNREGTLTADEVYALTAYLLFINGVIPEDQVLDAQSLPKVKMPIGDNYASAPRLEAQDAKAQGLPLLSLLDLGHLAPHA